MNDTYSVIYSPKAKDDLREIYSYIACDLQAPETSEGQVSRIRKEIRSLDFMPSHTLSWNGAVEKHGNTPGIDNFVLYYAVNDDSRTVTVIRIFYGGRDVEGIIQTEHE